MYKGLEFAAVGGVILALATGGSASALVPRTAKASKNCSNQTVSVGKGRPKQTLRLVVTGNASCAEAHRVVGSYFRKMAAGRCGLQNNRCALTVATGYGCSIISPVAERKELGGAFYGCVRSNAKILLYKTRKHVTPTPVPSNPSEFRVRLAGGTFGCAVDEVSETVCFGVPLTPEGSTPDVQVAKLQSGGQVTSCVERGPADAHCFEGNLGDPIPFLSPGQASTVGPFTCKVLEASINCIVTATGKGFLITTTEVMLMGA